MNIKKIIAIVAAGVVACLCHAESHYSTAYLLSKYKSGNVSLIRVYENGKFMDIYVHGKAGEKTFTTYETGEVITVDTIVDIATVDEW